MADLSAPTPSAREAARTAARGERTRKLLHDPIAPTLARLAAPNIIAMSVMAAMSIAEGWFAARLGLDALAGLALVFPLVMLTQMMSAGAFGGAISAAVARALGAASPERASALALAAWAVAAGMAGLFALAAALLGEPLFRLLGAGDGALAAALSYAGVFFPGCIALWLFHASLSTIRGTGDMLTPSLLLFAVSLGSIPLSGGLALGWGPLPALGMAGLAAGAVSAFALGCLPALGHILAGRCGLAPVAARRRVSFGDGHEIVSVGAVASLNAMQTVTTVVLMTGLVGGVGGVAALAGYGLGARLEFLLVPVVFGIGAAMTAMVGACIGAGDRARALRVAWTGSFGAGAIVGAIGLALALAPDLWLGLFLGPEEGEALAAGRAYFRTVAPAYAFFGVGLALYFASQGAARMAWPVTASFCRMGVAFGLALWLTTEGGWGLEGVYAGIAAGMAVYGVLTVAAIRITGWR